ncbi:MAG: amidase [Gemmatimonadaceae bacterium]|nr:amidase [Gemmatimonadaceae bacterium]
MRRVTVLALLGLLHSAAHAQARPQTSPVEVTEASITDLQAALSAKRTTSVALVDQYLARIRAYDHAGPALNAIIRVNPKARAEAAALDAERKAGKVRGPLHGIPIILKDNYDTGDLPTTAGSLALANSRPAKDGFVVQQLRAAGAIVLAKSNMHELAAGITSISSLGGQTRNPYDPARCPGGSSGGTGAAIAASFAAVGWGSDTCGSIRIPSAFGALFGLRPTIGMVSRTGIVPLSHTQDIGGPLARTMTDLAIALDATVGFDPSDTTTRAIRDKRPRFQAALDKDALKGARLGVLLPYFRDTDAEIADSIRAAVSTMRARGATVLDVAMPEFDTLLANTSVINMEMKSDIAAYLAGVPNAPVHSMGEILARGAFDRELEVRFRTVDTFPAIPNPAHSTTLARQRALRMRVEFLLDSLKLDALVYPTVRQKPVFPGQVQGGSTCPLGAQSGLPSIAMPVGFTADGLPVSVELLGKGFSDERLVALAFAYEQTGARRRAPTTTPALVNGAAPVMAGRTIITTRGAVQATSTITVDLLRNELRWESRLRAPGPGANATVVLMRRGGGTLTGPASSTSGSAPALARITIADSATRVVARLLGPDESVHAGVLPLTAADRDAYAAGRLSVRLVTNAGVVERPLSPSR